MDLKEYGISKKEMNRRKIAFICLEVSLYISTCLCLIDFILSGLGIAVPVMIFFAIALTLLALAFNKVHDRQSRYRVYISDNSLERDVNGSSDRYPLSQLKGMRIKRTHKGIIRELKFETNDGKIFFINGIDSDDFELFIADISERNKALQVTTIREPLIDFDHPLFYPALGIVLGVLSSFAFRFMLTAGEDVRIYIKNATACLVIGLGLFFILNRPTKRRYGNKRSFIIKDTVFGAVLLILGLCFIFFF